MKLSNIETIAKKVLTAKTFKTATNWQNKVNQLSDNERTECLMLISTHGNKNMIGYGAIYPNSYLIGGDFK